MDQGYKAGRVDPEVIAGTVKSVVQNHVQTQLVRQEANGRIPNWAAYPAADLFGRCFLRVCLWVDVFTSWTRRGELLAYQKPNDALAAGPVTTGHLKVIPAEVIVPHPATLTSRPPSA